MILSDGFLFCKEFLNCKNDDQIKFAEKNFILPFSKFKENGKTIPDLGTITKF